MLLALADEDTEFEKDFDGLPLALIDDVKASADKNV